MKQALIIGAILLFAAVIVFGFWFHGTGPENSLIQSAEASDGFMGKLAAMLRTDAAERDLRSASPIYAGNEEAFWITAAELPTFASALEIGKVATTSTQKIPYFSDQLIGLQTEHRLDQWGKPFCVTGDDKAVVILSTGGAAINLKCRITVDSDHIKGLPRAKLFKTKSGYFAMVVDRPNR